jgi:hypothetical protein
MRRLHGNWQEILGYQWRFNYGYLLASFGLGLLVSLFVAWAWNYVLRALKSGMRYRQALRIMSLSILAKYLPGMGWNYLAQLRMCTHEDVSKTAAGVSILLERSICFIGGVLAFLISLPFWREGITDKRPMFILLAIPLGLIAIHPRLLEKCLNMSLSLVGRETTNINVRYRPLLKLLILYILFGWGIGGIAFRLFIESLYPVDISTMTVIGILALSVNIGFLTPFMPGGLVVREAMMVSMLRVYMPMDVAIMIASGYRFLDSLREIVFAAVAMRL